jgi:hypothetical protein
VQVGLCYLPLGIGSLCSRWTAGLLLDWNFRRHARRHKIDLDPNKQPDLDSLPIEQIRLEISLPLVYLSAAILMAYGWTMETRSSLAGIEVSLFFCGLCFSGALNGLNVLIVDTHADKPATAVAANNLFRCLVGAGATALALPVIDAIGMGWFTVCVSALWVLASPALWSVLLYGAKWRTKLQERKKRKEDKSTSAERVEGKKSRARSRE